MDELLRGMSSAEMAEWMAYAMIEPFGESRADLRMGIIASLLANIHRDPKKRRQAYKPEDFIPQFQMETNIDERMQSATEKVRTVFSALAGGSHEER